MFLKLGTENDWLMSPVEGEGWQNPKQGRVTGIPRPT